MVIAQPTQDSTERRPEPTRFPFTIFGEAKTARQQWFRDGLVAEMIERGYDFRPGEVDDIQLVLNFTDKDDPQSFRRKAQGMFVVSITDSDEPATDYVRAVYPILVRSMANVAIYLVPNGGYPEAHFVTMEQGHYFVSQDADMPDSTFFAAIHDRLEPLATSQLVINNEYHPDLPKELWDGDETTNQLITAGRMLDEMQLLPAPFPIQEILGERDLRHVKRLYGIGGLSYGNLSARRDAETFWMSASGVNKGQLREIGRDILLVTDYDAEKNAMVLSVPPGVEPRRVSVDAIEHFIIYREHPGVGAIIHIHAWMDGIESTHINYPCGTRELALAVSELVRRAPDPTRAVVGLKNHGLTITGHSLPEIFARVEGKIIPQVPMS
jgi:hypothetical protein